MDEIFLTAKEAITTFGFLEWACLADGMFIQSLI